MRIVAQFVNNMYWKKRPNKKDDLKTFCRRYLQYWKKKIKEKIDLALILKIYPINSNNSLDFSCSWDIMNFISKKMKKAYWLRILFISLRNWASQIMSVWMFLYLVKLRTAWKSLLLFGQVKGYLNMIPIGLYNLNQYIWTIARGYSTTPPTKSDTHWQTANDWSPKKILKGNWWLPFSITLQKMYAALPIMFSSPTCPIWGCDILFLLLSKK